VPVELRASPQSAEHWLSPLERMQRALPAAAVRDEPAELRTPEVQQAARVRQPLALMERLAQQASALRPEA
jgi:hypothetical protein